jgi:hypothetical protein
MEEENGVVSLWLGTASSEEALEEALEVSFSEDGDFLGSAFSRAFEIGYYDADIIESEYHPGCHSLAELLKGASYESQIIHQLEPITHMSADTNCAILLYNYRHGGQSSYTTSNLRLDFVGTAKYST